MSIPQGRPFPFEKSFAALARVAFRETRATGYALFLQGVEGLHRVSALGQDMSGETLTSEGPPVLVKHALERDGLVAFSFRDAAIAATAMEGLALIFGAMQDLWSARSVDTRLIRLLARLTAAETRLIDSKIADRAEGLLPGERNWRNILGRHVSSVLRPGPAVEHMENLVKEREEELDERRVTGRAKAILQATRSFSEDEAYTHLRTVSRQTRRRLKDVAMDVIGASQEKTWTGETACRTVGR